MIIGGHAESRPAPDGQVKKWLRAEYDARDAADGSSYGVSRRRCISLALTTARQPQEKSSQQKKSRAAQPRRLCFSVPISLVPVLGGYYRSHRWRQGLQRRLPLPPIRRDALWTIRAEPRLTDCTHAANHCCCLATHWHMVAIALTAIS